MSLNSFLSLKSPSLKICGVTLAEDAQRLVELGVEALGINFWPKSKRYLAPEKAEWLSDLANKIVRVGVFVNGDQTLQITLVEDGLLDAIQLHGDESPKTVDRLRERGIPVIKALGIRSSEDLKQAAAYTAEGMLLDTHAPGVYGGTGEAFDWSLARNFRDDHPKMPLILAGGITPANAADAIAKVKPAALDVASGAEISPGVKDFTKVEALLAAIQ